jgi:hypothetical protein
MMFSLGAGPLGGSLLARELVVPDQDQL